MEKFLKQFTDNGYIKILSFIATVLPFVILISSKFNNTQNTMEKTFDWIGLITAATTSLFLIIIYSLFLYMAKTYKAMRIQNEAMQKQYALSRLFNFVMFEMNYKPDELMTDKRNKIIDEVKKQFLAKANQAFKDNMKQSDIEKMVNDYFDYTITKTPMLL